MYLEIEFPGNAERGDQSSSDFLNGLSDDETGTKNTIPRHLSRRRDRDAECRARRLRFAYGFAAQQGIRPTMEDAHLTGKEETLFLAGICDGHNGSQASSFFARHFYYEFKQNLVNIANQGDEPSLLQQQTIPEATGNFRKHAKHLLQSLEATIDQGQLYKTIYNDEEIKNAIINACDAVENRFMQLASQFDLDDGTTFCAVLLMNEALYCANIGDSRALCGSWRGITALSNDHKAENVEQYVRAAGGFVHPIITKTESAIIMSGPPRIFPGGLAVGRSIGDRQFKDIETLKTKAVVNKLVDSQPDIWKVPAVGLTYAFVGCDGVFDILSNEEVHKVLMVLSVVQNAGGLLRRQFLTKAGVGHELRMAGPGAAAADVITRLALTGGSTDNVSCCVMLFDHEPWPVLASVAEHLNIQGASCQIAAQDSENDSVSCVRDYGHGEFARLCTMALEGGQWAGAKGHLGLHDFVAVYDALEKFFCFPGLPPRAEILHDPDLSPEELRVIDEARRRLWRELQGRGVLLSQVRPGQHNTGIELANDARFLSLDAHAYKF